MGRILLTGRGVTRRTAARVKHDLAVSEIRGSRRKRACRYHGGDGYDPEDREAEDEQGYELHKNSAQQRYPLPRSSLTPGLRLLASYSGNLTSACCNKKPAGHVRRVKATRKKASVGAKPIGLMAGVAGLSDLLSSDFKRVEILHIAANRRDNLC